MLQAELCALWLCEFLQLTIIFVIILSVNHGIKRQPHKMVKYTQNNSSAKADELFECVWPSYGVGA